MRHTVKTNELKSITENKEEISIIDIYFTYIRYAKNLFILECEFFWGKRQTVSFNVVTVIFIL